MKICLLNRSLSGGGTEGQLCVLATELARRGHAVTVFGFYPVSDLSQFPQMENLKVLSLGKKGRWQTVSFFRNAVSAVRKENPQILQSYLSAANILSVLMKPWVKRARIVWGIRASNMDFRSYDWLHGFADRIEKSLSRFPDCVIANSQAGLDLCIRKNFPERNLRLVPNGIDTDRFAPDVRGGELVRTEWNVTPAEKLIGYVARLDAMKDHRNFLQAAVILSRSRSDVRFVCVGAGKPEYENQLRVFANGLGLQVIWAGYRRDLPQVYGSLDICNSSAPWGEGFPNAIGEAMACEVPCVVTDVGDSAAIVNGCGVVVPPGSPEKLAEGWEKALRMDKSRTGAEARKRIVENFNVTKMIEKTEQIYSEILERA